MDIAAYLSNFQLAGTAIKTLRVDNNFVNLIQDDATDNDVSVTYQVQEIKSMEKTGFIGLLDLSVDVVSKRNDRTLHLSLILQGCFTSKDSDQSQFETMLEINGASTLYSISRSLILSITGLTVQGDQMILPMVNFVEMANKK